MFEIPRNDSIGPVNRSERDVCRVVERLRRQNFLFQVFVAKPFDLFGDFFFCDGVRRKTLLYDEVDDGAADSKLGFGCDKLPVPSRMPSE